MPERTQSFRLPGVEPYANLPHPSLLRIDTFSHEWEKGRAPGVQPMPPRTSALQKSRARRLRRDQTIAEEILWRELRNSQLGIKFRRQVPVGLFIADFACVAAKLIVEVDGPSHESEAGAAKDAWRDRWFADNGWRIVRVSNALVTGGGDLSLAPIRAALADAGFPKR